MSSSRLRFRINDNRWPRLISRSPGKARKGSVMRCRIFVCMFVFTVVLTGSCLAADETFCPRTIKVEQKAISPSQEWKISYDPFPNQLEMVTFFSGPPEEEASLVYDKKTKIKGGWIGTWNFPKDPAGYWILCSYQGTRAELSRRLPDSVSVCRVTYDEGVHSVSGFPAIRKIECR